MKFCKKKKEQVLLILYLFLIIMTLALSEKQTVSQDLKLLKNTNEEAKVLKKYSNKNDLEKFYRFIQSKNTNGIKIKDEINIFIMNTEVLPSKPPAKKLEDEQEVFPRYARSGTFYSWGFAWWTFLSFPPENSIFGRSSKYWMSKNGVNEDFIEYSFEVVTKIDSMQIEWRLPPKTFKVEFKVTDNGAYIPLTEKFSKFEELNKDGSKGNLSQVTPMNALIFMKPIFAKAIKISMWEPLKSHKFSITKTRFYNEITTMVIVNQSVDKCAEFCLYVNTNKPVDGTAVEALNCLNGIATADNRELFQYYQDRSIRTYNDKKCLGFDIANNKVILKDCDYGTPFKVLTNKDNSLSFQGYENMCIVLDTATSISDNFVGDSTDLKASSEYDRGLYKKENILSK